MNGYVFVPAFVLLALHPAFWLVNTWQDEGYGSPGEWIFLLVVALASWSLRSQRLETARPIQPRFVVLLFLSAAAIRAAGQILALNTLSALVLVLGVAALGYALGLDQRQRRVSPIVLALLFALSLPVDRLLQRVIGYPLQTAWSVLPIDPAAISAGLPSKTLVAIACVVFFIAATKIGRPSRLRSEPTRPLMVLPVASVAVALGIFAIPPQPLDVYTPSEPPQLPAWISTMNAEPLPLFDHEAKYFAQYGATAVKARYHDSTFTHTLLAVTSGAPLRHLHAPEECLIGAGHKVRLIKTTECESIYESIAPDGSRWSVEVSYFNDRGVRAATTAEVVWRWIKAPTSSWTMIQRIRPWGACEANPQKCQRFDRALERIFEL